MVRDTNMDIIDGIATKLDVRQFSSQEVTSEIKQSILEAARMTGTGLNTQHWRFILVEGKDRLATLAEDSTSGGWVAGANFAIIVLTNPNYKFHMIDAGRVLQNMQLAAWSHGVASGIFTGVKEEKLRRDFAIPNELNIALIAGFGYPAKKLVSKKSRAPLNELVYYGRYGNAAIV
ncbi:MAG: nitroreductase family protein [Nitrososphaera sp.]